MTVLEDDLFRREAGRLVATLTRLFGIEHLALAEDVVQDALCRALEVWAFHGVPDNPSAWLLATAKHRAIDVLRRERTARMFAPDVARHLEAAAPPAVAEAFHPAAIRDDQLRLMFSCCQPELAEEAQVVLVLHVLCGFSVAEIAHAFLAGAAAIKKRIARARQALAASRRLFELADGEIAARLPAVHRALYLAFNEGFHGAGEAAVRADLCHHAIRLTALLLDHPASATTATRALLALMCFQTARLPGRLDALGDLQPLLDQDRARWDPALIAEGRRQMDQAATGSELTAYHVEAAIAAAHGNAPRAEDTPWPLIVSLYDLLLVLRPSPVVALQRAIAVAEHEGAARGLEELAAIPERDRLAGYPFHAAALGELELRCGRRDAARAHFELAVELARNPAERRFLARRADACGPPRPTGVARSA